MKELLRKKRLYLILLIPLGFLLTALTARFPWATDRIYSRGIYQGVARVIGGFFSLIPFSVAELLILVLLAVIPISLIVLVVRLIRDKEGRRKRLLNLVANLFCTAGCLYFVFVLVCGINYTRPGFAELNGLEIRPSSVEELSALCTSLVEQCNAAEAATASNEAGVSTLSFENHRALTDACQAAYSKAGEEYDTLSRFVPRAKAVISSRAMSYLDITGVYFPFTFECNVNVDHPEHNVPATILHEMAHFKGFMREEDANFIAYLVSGYSDDPELTYSGTLLATVYATNALFTADPEEYSRVASSLSDGVRTDLAAAREYWQQFATPVAKVSNSVNNTYLRANRQQEGVKSYGRMVDLLLAEYRQENDIG